MPGIGASGFGSIVNARNRARATATPSTGTAPGGGPLGQGAFNALLPAILNQQTAFARPEAANWLASTQGAAPPAWSQPQPVAPSTAPAPGTGGSVMPAAGRPWMNGGPSPALGLGAAGRPWMNGGPIKPQGPSGMLQQLLQNSPFAQLMFGMPGAGFNTGGTPGPAPDPFLALNRFAGPFGNGGGALVPQLGGAGRLGGRGLQVTQR